MRVTNLPFLLFVRSKVPRVVLAIWLISPAVLQAEIALPTPLQHYEEPAPSIDLPEVAAHLLPRLDAPQQQLLFEFLSDPDDPALRARAVTALRELDGSFWRRPVLEHLLHRSHVLEVIPESHRSWLPIVHDGLLFFLDWLPEERLWGRVLEQLGLGEEASTGELLLSFLSHTPTLQKIGQILARNPDLPEEVRQALQVLENSLRTTSAEAMRQFVIQDVGQETIKRHRIELSDRILAEATVGAVMRCRLLLPGDRRPREAVVKIIKPEALAAMQEELEIFDRLAAYFTAHRDFYEIGTPPLPDMFEDLRLALSKEVEIVNEQSNLEQAREYYATEAKVLVPELYPFSTRNVTFMEFVEGEKISSAFQGRSRQRAGLARRLLDVMVVEVLLSSREKALFHGDPHAGNIFHVLDDPTDPFRIAMLDWGLSQTLSRSQRASLMQQLLGVHVGDTKRIIQHLGALVEGDEWKTRSEQREIRRIVEEILDGDERARMFDLLRDLLTELARRGYRLRFNIALFIKSQITLAGILAELDPDLKPDDYVMERFSHQVFRELPKRLLYTLWIPAWNSHRYPSMLSNEDVKDLQVRKAGRRLKWIGRGLWRGLRRPFQGMGQ